MALLFPNLGGHCAVSDCSQLDFLPFTCNACKEKFCLDHRGYEAHKCEKGRAKSNEAFFCPECNESINVGFDGDRDEKLAKHFATECPSSGFQKKVEENPKKKCCVVRNCGVKASFYLSSCRDCGAQVCITHRFEHRCVSRRLQAVF
mmetsp:Transcript_29428/g.40674  ORF Transcript_29428/g.40674 Transcript_29428/m.40674 type:complete len:147 (+) Transcript_29428:82-522(+)